jgi:hypothetical protein
MKPNRPPLRTVSAAVALGILPLLPWAWDLAHTPDGALWLQAFVKGHTLPLLPLFGSALLGLAQGNGHPENRFPWAPPVALALGNAAVVLGLASLSPRVAAGAVSLAAWHALRDGAAEWALYETARWAGRLLGWLDGTLGVAAVVGVPPYAATLLNLLYVPPPLPYPAPGVPPVPPVWVRPAIGALMNLVPWGAAQPGLLPAWLSVVGYSGWALACHRGAAAVRRPYGTGPFRHVLRAVVAGAAAAPVVAVAITHGRHPASTLLVGLAAFLVVAALVYRWSRSPRPGAPRS